MAHTPTVGIVGAGFITQNVHLPVLSAMTGVRVAWIADIDGRRAEETGRAFGTETATLLDGPSGLPDADVLLLTVPVGARAPYHAEWARRGAAVFAEKPFARSVEEHRRLLSGFEPSRIGCGFMRRAYVGVRAMRALIGEGWFGPLRHVVVAEGGRTTRSGSDRPFLDDPSLAGGGVLIDYGSHALDALVYATRADGGTVERSAVTWDGDVDRAVVAEVALHCPGGSVPAVIDISWIERKPNRFVLDFDRATVTVGTAPEGPVEIAGKSGEAAHATVLSRLRGATTSYQAFYLEWKEFLDGWARRVPSEYSAASCLNTTALVEGIYRVGGRS